MLPEKARFYLMKGLESAPVVIKRMLRTADSVDWDRRPDPERFSLREVLSHLADWEPIWLERIRRMAEEDNEHRAKGGRRAMSSYGRAALLRLRCDAVLSGLRQLRELLPHCGERLLVSVTAVNVGQTDQHLQRGCERVIHC